MGKDAGEVGHSACIEDGANPVLNPTCEAADGGGGLNDNGSITAAADPARVGGGGGGGGGEDGDNLGDGAEVEVEELLGLVADDLVLDLAEGLEQRLPLRGAGAHAQPSGQIFRPVIRRRRRHLRRPEGQWGECWMRRGLG